MDKTKSPSWFGIFILIFGQIFLSGCSFVIVKDSHSKKTERRSASFEREPWVHPKMIWELKPWMSDTGEQMIALNVSNSVGSNRYFEDIEKRSIEGGKELLLYKAQNGEHLQFGYVYHGMSNSGIHVLEVVESTHGSGTFISLFLLIDSNTFGFNVCIDAPTAAIFLNSFATLNTLSGLVLFH